jgi:hypothetical protein
MEKVKPSRPCESLKKSILRDAKKNKFFNLPLSESEIIELHNILMTPAQHAIYTSSVTNGRALINTMLHSLAYYHYVGCLTTNMWDDSQILDIFKIIHKDAQVHGLWYAIDLFFINYHYLDFIWVELTDQLLVEMGLKYVTQMCHLLTKHQSIPVVILNYEKLKS